MKDEHEEALQRLMHAAEIGGWYNDESTVAVRIGDLYKVFNKIRAQSELLSECSKMLKVED